MLDVVVDLRKGSPTFKKHFTVELSEDNKKQIFVPRGFGNGFSVLSKDAILQYKCDNFYNAKSEGSVKWDDSELLIDWGLKKEDIILSDKDNTAPLLKEAKYLFDYNDDLYDL